RDINLLLTPSSTTTKVMPLRTESLSRSLWIELDRCNGWFAPGETIRGTIHRSGTMVASRARISLTLHGSSECQVSLDGGRATSVDTRTSNFDLVDPENLEEIVFNGLVNAEFGECHAKWPFAFTIPRVA